MGSAVTAKKIAVTGFTSLVILILVAAFTTLYISSRRIKHEPNSTEWKRTELLSNTDEISFKLSWKVDSRRENITFEITARTSGWIGFGLSAEGGMAGADLIIGGIHDNTSKPYFNDYYSELNEAPRLDPQQDWFLLNASQTTDGFTSLTFWRNITTCDDRDLDITVDSTRFIWAIGSTDEILYHGVKQRGSHPVNILDVPPPPIELDGFPSIPITLNVTLPPKESMKWCSVHKTPIFPFKRHIIAIGPNSNTSQLALQHTHRMTLKICEAPEDMPKTEVEKFFDNFVDGLGDSCANDQIGRSQIYEHCRKILYTWGSGGKMLILPEDVGLTMNPGRQYFLLEMHLNNPGGLENIRFETGIHVYYTEKIRKIEGGILSITGASQSGLVIPPDSSNFLISSHCDPICTDYFGPEGVTVFNVNLHAHKSAQKMRIRHFRAGHELPRIIDDGHFISQFQDNRNVHWRRVVPLDHLTLECEYENRWLNGSVTIQGDEEKEEVCAGTIFYYPKKPLHTCQSSLNKGAIFDLLGVANSFSGDVKFDIASFLKESVNWSPEIRGKIQAAQSTGPQISICQLDRRNTELPKMITRYPKNLTVLKPPQERDCSGRHFQF